MKRRNTFDSASWPMCPYYYTHNMGSCDDVLLQNKRNTTPGNQLQYSNTMLGVRRSVRVRKKRRFTYPVVLLDQQAYTRQFQENNNTKTAGPLLRRWSTISQLQRRQTLSKITAGETRPDSVDDNEGVIAMAIDTRSSRFSLGYKTQLQDEEKTEKKSPPQTRQSKTPLLRVVNDDTERVVVDEKVQETAPSSIEIHRSNTGANTSTTLMDSGVNINSSLIAHAPSSSVHSTEEQANDDNQYHAMNSHEGSTTNSQNSSSTTDEESVFVSMSENSYSSNSSIDMFLFLFGFLFFPLWWVGAWKYIMQTHVKTAKRREVFQILNCCMSLSSLILLGLIIGLVTVWA